MSLKTVTELHEVSHTRYTSSAGATGGPVRVPSDQGDKLCTINPDSDFESQDFDTRNQELGYSIYFNTDPQVQTDDILQVLREKDIQTGVWEDVTDGTKYRVQSVLNFQRQNRLWRVRAIHQTAIPR